MAILVLVFLAVIATIAVLSLRPHRAPSAAGESATAQATGAQQIQTDASGMPLQQPYAQPGVPSGFFGFGAISGFDSAVALYPGMQSIPGAPDFYSTADTPQQIEAFYRTIYPEARISAMPGRTAINFTVPSGDVSVEIAQVPAGSHVWIRRQ